MISAATYKLGPAKLEWLFVSTTRLALIFRSTHCRFSGIFSLPKHHLIFLFLFIFFFNFYGFFLFVYPLDFWVSLSYRKWWFARVSDWEVSFGLIEQSRWFFCLEFWSNFSVSNFDWTILSLWFALMDSILKFLSFLLFVKWIPSSEKKANIYALKMNQCDKLL